LTHEAAEEAPWRQRVRDILSQRQRQILSRDDLTPSAVLVPIYEEDGEWHIVLTKRSDAVEHHKGQVSFPGGAHDASDGDLEATALREAFEEVGIRPEDVEILGNLDEQETLSSHFAVSPYVGAIPYPYEFRISREEVETLIEAPVSALLAPESFSTQTPDAGGKLHPWGYYRYDGHYITGVTALMLKQLLDLVFSRG
jgi:8-oxo-dGTP pyrophosphatase MutT (NUDIX family)